METLQARAALVALDTRWATNPVVASASTAFTTALPHGSRIECQVHLPVGSPIETAMLDQLVLLRVLVGPVTDLRVLTRSSNGYEAEGRAAGHPVDLSLVCTDADLESASVRLLTTDGSVKLTIPSGLTAQPARLTRDWTRRRTPDTNPLRVRAPRHLASRPAPPRHPVQRQRPRRLRV